jgi:heme exporter protein D
VSTPSLSLGTRLLVLAGLVFLSFFALLLVLLLLVLETIVRSRVELVGVASVTTAERRLLKVLSGLSFCGRVETNFDAVVFKGY